MRLFALITTVVLLSPGAASGQQQQAAARDSGVQIGGHGMPAGWVARLDDKEVRHTLTDARFEIMGSGYHVTSGPAALYFNEMHRADGAFAVRAHMTQMKAPLHAEGYGIFVGGSELRGAAQQYFYLLVRGDGKYFIAHRAGDDVHKIVPWTDHRAIRKQDEAGQQSNDLVIQVTTDSMHMRVNGERVRSFAKSEMRGFATDGQTGIRVNHNLDVHIGSFDVKRD